MTQNILVTGGAGFIGSHTCKALAARGYTPIALDNLSNGHEWAVKWGPLIKGDISDRALLDRIFKEYNPAGVIHFAAFIEVGISVRNPGSFYRNNTCGTLTVLEAMRDHGCERFVFSSTAAVYGMPHEIPLTETHPQWPINPYGWSKFMVERMLEDFSSAHGLRFCALRYFNAAGADPECEIGEAHDPESHLIPLVLRAARHPEKPITVFGTDYDTPDGTCIRDYIHVNDLADAHIRALDYLAGNDSVAINLGTGTGNSVQEIIEAAREVTGAAIEPNLGIRRAGDPPRLVADRALAREKLGWEPHYTGIIETIRHAWQWMNRA
ncbi:UDP-glucose 4-epimerase GalE [Pseudodesulfovibrio piezophilus]|uniref:UDP-glucose 4-epimerase n=1 Tax=Pseudodesulfovibrio piezophilus (strain DSM 21447 / JCM 15486 / C1TLV30) TaxID=1322246 RepID=M1WKB1_PSEP2|nr:UDP-glucose 4-epimerase GalE [Pseudodesulfovibrio piezophilus]CCH49291.1 UDP-glucose 4-epimerase [Pseudodesulfovibrio piezophilus C1TLV30]